MAVPVHMWRVHWLLESTPSSLGQTCPHRKRQVTGVKLGRMQVHFANFSCITIANILLAKEDHRAELRIKGEENIFHVLIREATKSYGK